jgi:hypothetical protein
MPSFAVTAILKSLGVNIGDEDIRKIEQFIPQLPAKAQELIQFNVAMWKAMDARLEALEKGQLHDRITLSAICEHQLKLKELIKDAIQGRDARPVDTSADNTGGSGADSRTHTGSGRRNGVTRRSN